MKRPIVSENAPRAIGPYSQAIAVNGGEMIFCSGQIGLDPKTGEMVKGGVESEARRVLENLRAVLAAADATMDHVVRSTIYLTDLADFQRVGEIYGSFFSGSPPARVTIGVASLPKGAKVEIDAIAVRP